MRPKWLAGALDPGLAARAVPRVERDGDDARRVETAERGFDLPGIAGAEAQAITLGVEAAGHGEADPAIGARHHDDAILR